MMISCTDLNICQCEIERNKFEGEFLHFTKLQDALSCSEKADKPILIIFTSWSGVGNSRHTWEVFEDKEISNLISKKFIELVLHIDEQVPLEEEYTSCYLNKEKKIRTVGQKNTDFQRSEFHTTSCPYYVIIDSKKSQMVEAIGYTRLENKSKFERFLKDGLTKYKSTK